MGAIGIESSTPEAVWARLRPDWLVTVDDTDTQADLPAQVQQRRTQLAQYADKHQVEGSLRPMVLIAETSPTALLASFWAGILSGWDIVLTNPSWGDQEWHSVSQLTHPNIIWQSAQSPVVPFQPSTHLKPAAAAQSAILIPTGGSSGQIKFARHTWNSLLTATLGFLRYFSSPINTCCVLPIYHVSGLMQALRTSLSNGQLFLISFKSLLSASILPPIVAPGHSQISLVPTQLERLLRANKAQWLSQFNAVLLGGAPPWPSLLERAAASDLSLYLSYGMTETAAMVTLSKLQSDGHSSGYPLPHATVKIERTGERLPAGEIGQIVIYSEAVASGYYDTPSSAFAPHTFYTDDLGYIDSGGRLQVTGRASRKIISGGENVFPDEIEAVLRSTEQISDVFVLGWPHAEWGEVVTAVYVPTDDTVTPACLKAALTHLLSRYKHPKQWVALSHLPRNAQGKLNHTKLIAQVEEHLNSLRI